MAQALLITTLITIAGLVVTIVAGFRATTGAEIGGHILLALVTVVIGLFSQSMTMFFFIGTGKEIKEEAKGEPDEEAVVNETKLYKAHVFPAAMWAIGAIMATFILGGGVHTGKIPVWTHLLLSTVTLVLFVRAYWIEFRAMMRNAKLMERFLRDRGD